MRKPMFFSLLPILLGSVLAAPASANDKKDSPPPVSCAELATDPANALGGLIGGSTLGFPIIQQFNMFSAAQMGVSTTP